MENVNGDLRWDLDLDLDLESEEEEEGSTEKRVFRSRWKKEGRKEEEKDLKTKAIYKESASLYSDIFFRLLFFLS